MPLSPLLTPQDLPPRTPRQESEDALAILRHQVVAWFRPVALKLGSQPIAASFSFGPVDEHRATEVVIESKCHGAPFRWAWHELPDFGRLQPELAGLDLRLLPQELGLSVLDWLFESPLQALEKMGLSLKVEKFLAQDTEGSVADLGWKLELPDLQCVWTGSLQTDAKGLKLLADVIATVPVELELSQAEHRINTSLEWGHQILSNRALADLKPHDLVVLKDQELRAQKATFLVQTQARGTAQLVENAWQLAGVDSPQRALEADQVLLSVTSFPVSQTLSELQQMRLNAPLNFPSAPEGRVLLWSDGRCLGEGEWMPLGEVAAVRIVELKDA